MYKSKAGNNTCVTFFLQMFGDSISGIATATATSSLKLIGKRAAVFLIFKQKYSKSFDGLDYSIQKKVSGKQIIKTR